MKHRIVTIVTLFLTLAALTLAGCAKPTADSQKARYQRVKDRLDALGTKSPALRPGIQLKLADLDRDLKVAEAKGGAEAVKALGEVASRAEAFEREITPAPAATSAAGPTPAPGGKLGAPPTTPPPAAPGGKLGDPAAPAAPAGAGNSGFGGSATTTTTTTTTTTPAVPAPPAPAPTAPAPPASGFGGQ